MVISTCRFQFMTKFGQNILGSLDASVQPITRSVIKEIQRAYYSGKNKIHCVKTQALVSPTGLLIHASKPVERSIHDFQLFKISNLDELIAKENEKCELVLGFNATTLTDSGYQGIMKILPGSITPWKKFRN